jgi:LPXTG-motif cell wall-anchored protein
VWHVSPPNSVILTLENGTNQSFKIPKGQKFTIDGQEVDAFGLRKGMVVTATKIVEVPEVVVSQRKYVSGTIPEAPPADVPMLIASGEPTSSPRAASPAETTPALATKLPKTGSDWPLVGLLGLILVSASLGVRLLRVVLGH